MFKPELHLPQQIMPNSPAQELDATKVQEWMEGLSYRDTDKLAEQVLDGLRKINRIKRPIEVRCEIMAMLESPIANLMTVIGQQCSAYSFPLSKRRSHTANVLQHLLLEMAIGYKFIVHEIIHDDDKLKEFMGNRLPNAIRMSIKHLSELLVERYMIYLSEPVNVWLEVHQLYLLAERLGIETLEHPKKDPKSTILHQYIRIVVLSMADPYRLMQCETFRLYEQLDEWALSCELSAFGHKQHPGKFVVDLNADKRPFLWREDDMGDITEGRLVIIDSLLERLEKAVDELAEEERETKQKLSVRQRKEMYTRIINQLTFTGSRQDERVFAGGDINMAIGLSAAHHFVSGEQPFEPELADEPLERVTSHNRLEDDEAPAGPKTLSLQDFSETNSPRKNRLKHINQFTSEDDLVGDQWEHIYTSAVINARVRSGDSDEVTKNFRQEKWQQRNESSGGMLLVCDAEMKSPIRVGMLAAYKIGQQEQPYKLGIIRWMRVNPTKGMAVGIMKLADEGRAVGVKALSGTGKGGEYNRSVLLPEQSDGTQPTLVLPTGIYDVGTVLRVVYEEMSSKVRIRQFTFTTSTITIASFDILAD